MSTLRGTFQDKWRQHGSQNGPLFVFFVWQLFWRFFQVCEKSAPEEVFGGLLASADPREPKYSFGQTHFFAHQRFSVSVAFGGSKSHPKDAFSQPFGSFLEVFLDVFFDVFFGVVFGTFFETFWSRVGLLGGALGVPDGGEKGSKIDVFS